MSGDAGKRRRCRSPWPVAGAGRQGRASAAASAGASLANSVARARRSRRHRHAPGTHADEDVALLDDARELGRARAAARHGLEAVHAREVARRRRRVGLLDVEAEALRGGGRRSGGGRGGQRRDGAVATSGRKAGAGRVGERAGGKRPAARLRRAGGAAERRRRRRGSPRGAAARRIAAPPPRMGGHPGLRPGRAHAGKRCVGAGGAKTTRGGYPRHRPTCARPRRTGRARGGPTWRPPLRGRHLVELGPSAVVEPSSHTWPPRRPSFVAVTQPRWRGEADEKERRRLSPSPACAAPVRAAQDRNFVVRRGSPPAGPQWTSPPLVLSSTHNTNRSLLRRSPAQPSSAERRDVRQRNGDAEPRRPRPRRGARGAAGRGRELRHAEPEREPPVAAGGTRGLLARAHAAARQEWAARPRGLSANAGRDDALVQQQRGFGRRLLPRRRRASLPGAHVPIVRRGAAAAPPRLPLHPDRC